MSILKIGMKQNGVTIYSVNRRFVRFGSLRFITSQNTMVVANIFQNMSYTLPVDLRISRYVAGENLGLGGGVIIPLGCIFLALRYFKTSFGSSEMFLRISDFCYLPLNSC